MDEDVLRGVDFPPVFEGQGFLLDPEQDNEDLREFITKAGGRVYDRFAQGCTYALVESREKEFYRAATEDWGLPTVTSYWVSACIRTRKLLVHDAKTLFQPVPTLEGVPGMEHVVVSLSGYKGDSRNELKDLVCTMGGQCTGTLSRENTHLVCYEFEGKKWEKAVEWRMKVVNHMWLEDSFRLWEMADESKYTESGIEVEQREQAAHQAVAAPPSPPCRPQTPDNHGPAAPNDKEPVAAKQIADAPAPAQAPQAPVMKEKSGPTPDTRQPAQGLATGQGSAATGSTAGHAAAEDTAGTVGSNAATSFVAVPLAGPVAGGAANASAVLSDASKLSTRAPPEPVCLLATSSLPRRSLGRTTPVTPAGAPSTANAGVTAKHAAATSSHLPSGPGGVGPLEAVGKAPQASRGGAVEALQGVGDVEVGVSGQGRPVEVDRHGTPMGGAKEGQSARWGRTEQGQKQGLPSEAIVGSAPRSGVVPVDKDGKEAEPPMSGQAGAKGVERAASAQAEGKSRGRTRGSGAADLGAGVSALAEREREQKGGAGDGSVGPNGREQGGTVGGSVTAAAAVDVAMRDVTDPPADDVEEDDHGVRHTAGKGKGGGKGSRESGKSGDQLEAAKGGASLGGAGVGGRETREGHDVVAGEEGDAGEAGEAGEDPMEAEGPALDRGSARDHLEWASTRTVPSGGAVKGTAGAGAKKRARKAVEVAGGEGSMVDLTGSGQGGEEDVGGGDDAGQGRAAGNGAGDDSDEGGGGDYEGGGGAARERGRKKARPQQAKSKGAAGKVAAQPAAVKAATPATARRHERHSKENERDSVDDDEAEEEVKEGNATMVPSDIGTERGKGRNSSTGVLNPKNGEDVARSAGGREAASKADKKRESGAAAKPVAASSKNVQHEKTAQNAKTVQNVKTAQSAAAAAAAAVASSTAAARAKAVAKKESSARVEKQSGKGGGGGGKKGPGTGRARCFAFSVSADKKASMRASIRKLKGTLAADGHDFDPSTTHLIMDTPLRRNEKLLASLAAGRWVLKPSYVTECAKAGELRAESAHECHASGPSDKSVAVDPSAPRYWRTRREEKRVGAFHGTRALLYGDMGMPPVSTLVRAIHAGGGEVLATAPPYPPEVLAIANVAVVDRQILRANEWVERFLRAGPGSLGIACVAPQYLVEWVAKPREDHREHVLFGSHEGVQRWVGEMEAAAERAAAEGEDEDEGEGEEEELGIGSDEPQDLMVAF
eukprot:jgi/Mesvir1/5202/Mv15335-RA.1